MEEEGILPEQKDDMSTLVFDPPEGFSGKNIFPDPVKTPTYMELWDIEKNLPYHDWRIWIGSHYKLPVHFCFIYVLGIFLGQIFMRRKAAYDLRRVMIIWNLCLAAFSLTGFSRSYPEVLHLLNYRPNGFYRITCSREEYNNASAFWSVVGVFSKVVELGDTAFHVLRKRPVIFLHWFHHATVMIYTWTTFEFLDPAHRWFTVMNYFIHAIMYSYYALSAMKIKVPKQCAMCITLLQLSQMVAGVGINVYSLVLIHEGTPCARNLRNLQMVLCMYLTYLLLFAQFFYSSYIVPRRAKGQGHANGRCHCE